jgi:hypothetical protein
MVTQAVTKKMCALSKKNYHPSFSSSFNPCLAMISAKGLGLRHILIYAKGYGKSSLSEHKSQGAQIFIHGPCFLLFLDFSTQVRWVNSSIRMIQVFEFAID